MLHRTGRPNAERDRLISEHIEIARRISLRMARRCPDWITRDDLVAAGMLGLTEAAERYDDTRNEPFLSFAEKRIRGAVLDELRRGDIMPRRVRHLARKVGQTIQELERELGTPPSDEQVAERLGVTIDEYRANLEQLVHVTVGALETGDNTAAMMTSDEHLRKRRRDGYRRCRGSAPHSTSSTSATCSCSSLYYNEELTYAEIAQVLRVTVSRVCQLHGRAIARLRVEIVGPEAKTGAK